MPSSNVCWGIEIGSGSISGIKLESSGSGFNVLDFCVLPHKRVLSTPEVDQTDAMRVALGAFASQFDLTGSRVAVSVPGHSAFARFAKLPPVEPKKVPDIVKFEAVQQIPFPIDDVEWDYQTFVSPDSPEVEVGIFAITRDRIMERLRLYEDVGMVPDCVTLAPVAAYNAIAYDLGFGSDTPGTILLDIGTTSTDLVISEPGRVWIRTFPIGGHHFTEALVSAFQLSYPKAEKLKREAESTKHARHVFQAMRPVFADLAQDVQRSIGYYQSLHKDAKLTRLIGLGSTFRLPGIRKFLRQQLQLDVYRLEQFKRLSVEGPRGAEFQSLALNLATAYGLALQGLGEAALDVNLMPSAVVKAAMWKRKVAWFGVAAGVSLAASGAMFIRPFIDRTQIGDNPRPAVVGEVINRVRTLKAEASEVTGGAPNLVAADLMGLLQNRGYYAQVVDDVSRIVASAAERAKNWPEPGSSSAGPVKAWGPALVVKSLKTTYDPPVTGTDTVSGYGEPVSPHPARIRVELEVETTQPEALRFALRTIDEWLKSNAVRAGVPYKIVAGSPATRVVNVVTISGETGGAASAAASQPGQPPRSGRRGASERPLTGEDIRRLDAARTDVIRTGEAQRPAPSSSQRQASESWSRGLSELQKAAPLPDPPSPPPGTVVTTIRVAWDAELTTKPASEGGL
jgi:type IV pilus assembly protein PilM